MSTHKANLNDLLSLSNDFADAKSDYHVPMSDLAMGGTTWGSEHRDHLIVPGHYTNDPFGTPPPVPVTPRAAKQLASILNLSSPNKLIENDLLPNAPGIFGDMVNHFSDLQGYGQTARSNRDKEVLIRQIAPVEGYYDRHIVRSFKGSRYIPFDVHGILTILSRMMEKIDRHNIIEQAMPTLLDQYGDGVEVEWTGRDEDGGIGRVLNWSMGPDEFDITYGLNLKVTPNDGPEGGNAFQPTIKIKSSDIRGMAINILPGAWREVCRNGMVRHYGRDEIKDMNWLPYISHVGSPDRLVTEVANSIQQAMLIGGTFVAQVNQAALYTLQQPENILENIISSVVPKDQRQQALLAAGVGTEGRRDVMAVINGLTWAAHQAQMDQDTRHILETVGGTALSRIGGLEQVPDDKLDQAVDRLFASITGAQLLEVESE